MDDRRHHIAPQREGRRALRREDGRAGAPAVGAAGGVRKSLALGAVGQQAGEEPLGVSLILVRHAQYDLKAEEDEKV